MLTPQDLENIPNEFIELFSQFETFVIQDISRRLAKTGKITSTAEWQKQRASLYGIKNVEKNIAETLFLSEKQIEKMFPQIAELSVTQENKIYEKAGLDTATIKGNKQLEDYITAAIQQTKGELKNITNSLGFASEFKGKVIYSNLTDYYRNELNLANVKITSGVQDYNSAIKDAVKRLSKSGVRYINYESGYSNNMDVAIRRSVLTSLHQMTQHITDFNMEKIIPNESERFCEVSAHQGARTGIGINNHQAWQGRVYKVIGSTKDYPNLVEKTGLGMPGGLKSYNCRHSYMPFIVGASVRTYTDEQLENIDPKPFKYKGKEYNAYEATQYQRKIETAMRQTKRELIAYKEAGLEEEFKITSAKLQMQKKEYSEFSKASGISKKDYRHQVEGFTQSLARQATNAAK